MRTFGTVVALCIIFWVTTFAARYTYWRLIRKGRQWERLDLPQLWADTFYFALGVWVAITLL